MICPFSFQNLSFIRAGFLDKEESLTFSQPILMTQVHSADVIVLKEPPSGDLVCDALVTDYPDLKLTVKTADCAPVLFVDEEKHIIGAAHAGWKGAFQGVMENTVLKMISLGASVDKIKVAIGPHLTQKSFQVSESMRALFPKTEHLFFQESDKGIYFDFTAYLKHRLNKIGIQNPEVFSLDTFSNKAYNSYRREPDNPARQYSFIQLIKGESHV